MRNPMISVRRLTTATLLALVFPGACSDERSPTGPAGDPDMARQPDALTITIVDPPTTLAPGATAQLVAVVTNQAGRSVNAQVRWSSSDLAVATVSEQGLLTAVAAGTAAIEARVGNFAASFDLTVGASDPDLVLSALALSASEVAIGDALLVSATLDNPTSADAGTAELRIEVLGDLDDVVHSVILAQPALAAGGTLVLGATLTADASWPASVRIRGHTDAAEVVMEQDETNNVVVTEPVTITAPDLSVAAVSLSAPSVVLGCAVTVQATVRNAGNALAAATTSAILLRSPEGAELARFDVAHGALAPGEETTLSATWPADASWPASVEVLARADQEDGVVERDESNNEAAAPEALAALVAPPPGFTKLWICGMSGDWHTAANWLPEGVPGASDDVYVPAGTPLSPSLRFHVQVNHITVEDGVTVFLAGNTLTATGNVLGGEFTSLGRLVLRGSPSRLRGTLPTLRIEGDVTLVGATVAAGRVDLLAGGSLTVGGHSLRVAGSFVSTIAEQGTDGLRMVHPDDELDVGGWVVLLQGAATASSNGSFTAGTLTVRGQQLVSNGAETFYSTGTTLVLAGTDPQVTTIVGRSRLHDVLIDNPAGVTMGTTHVYGRLTLAPGGVLQGGSRAELHFYGHLPVTGPGYQFLDNRVSGEIVMDRDATFPNGTRLWIRPGGRLTVNGQRLTVSGLFTVNMTDGRADGLIMTRAGDRVVVGSWARFIADAAAVDTEGSFSAGELRVGGSFLAQGASPKAFVSTGTTVVLDGTAAQEIAIVPREGLNGSRFHDLVIENDLDGAYVGGGFPNGGSSGITVTGQLTMVGDALLDNPQGHNIRFTSALPITGPGYAVDNNRVHGPIVMDRDAAIPNGGHLSTHAGGRVVLNGHRLTVDGQLVVHLVTAAEDGLVMTNPADELVVNGDLVYEGGGGTSLGSLTDGIIRLRARFAQRLNHASFRRDVFASTGTRVIFEGDGSPQEAAWHTPWDGGATPGSYFHDMVVAPGARVVQGSFGSTFVTGTADVAGTLENVWGATWIAASTLVLRSTARLLIDSGAVCYGTLTEESGAVVQLTPPGGSAYFGMAGGDPHGRGACAP